MLQNCRIRFAAHCFQRLFTKRLHADFQLHRTRRHLSEQGKCIFLQNVARNFEMKTDTVRDFLAVMIKNEL